MASTFPSGSSTRNLRFVARREPGKLPAAVLAIVVHIAFFAVVVFGVSWQVRHPAPLVAELWDQLPPLRNETPPEQPAPQPPPPPPPEPEVKKAEPVKPVVESPSKAEIQLKAKKEKAEREKAEREKAEREKVEKAEKAEKLKKAEDEKKRKAEEAQKKAAKAAEEKARAEQAAREAAAATARNAALQDYAARISALIRSRANIPDTVSGKPALTVRLRLLVNGAVFDAQVVKPSGNRVYDEAVERAINGIRQWPLPESAELFGGRRELNLNIVHER